MRTKSPIMAEGFRSTPVEFQKFNMNAGPWVTGLVEREVKRPGEHYFEIVADGRRYNVTARHIRSVPTAQSKRTVLVVQQKPKKRWGYRHTRAIAVALIILGSLAAYPARASQDTCGIPPIPPVGCDSAPTCICGPDGCDWYYAGCR